MYAKLVIFAWSAVYGKLVIFAESRHAKVLALLFGAVGFLNIVVPRMTVAWSAASGTWHWTGQGLFAVVTSAILGWWGGIQIATSQFYDLLSRFGVDVPAFHVPAFHLPLLALPLTWLVLKISGRVVSFDPAYRQFMDGCGLLRPDD